MKNLTFFEKIIFFINSIVAFLLLLSYVLPNIPPKTFATLSVLSLGVPFLILLNVLFFVYWLFKIKKQLLLSLIVVTIGYFLFGSLYKFSNWEEDGTESLSIMNYNVRLFNLYEWIPGKDIDQKLVEFVKKENPDILCLQEYQIQDDVDFSNYKYKYEKLEGQKIKMGQAIFSKYPIIHSGSIEFPKTANNAIFADIVKEKDTIRVYNLHLQSLRIDPRVQSLTTENSEKLINGIGETFKMQQSQAELFLKHKTNSPYKVIISGDFNNSAFSYVYKTIKADMKDAFKQQGNGFGRTYNFKFFPLRIDFLLVDKSYTINSFKTYDVEYSDHYPIMARISF
ncbi:endonuclease/exonuclease/phosphatase family protein [Olleya aquimaris]|uniref:Endonuclease/exonuclease/phosphatase family metal-dependent hydrolase n=1 Tax=Olleya aquimaris TaxID=639310 RepID=A0A327RSU1_9FLAO|nr:endonuclease/exonuclease/phosphatase family protein [Olleya aquimaris]RAJ16787.1 endonuclease/exonuclease/phosphatase family metal-dependent hydrolase [Olleya aquimaris]